MTSSIIVGEVDRISTSGNGILREDGGEYNLGPLDRSTVEETVFAVPVNDTWAVCLTPSADLESYLTRFCLTAGIDKTDAKQLLGGVDSRLYGTEFNVGDVLEVEVTASTPNGSYLVLDEGVVVDLVDTYLPTGTRTKVEIVEVGALVSKARLDKSLLEQRPQPGTELTVTIQEKIGTTGYSIRDGVPILLPNCAGVEEDELRVGVESLETNRVRATVGALSFDSRPEVGDVLELDVGLSGEGAREVQILDGIPIAISQPAQPIDESVPIKITGIEANTVSACIDFESYGKSPEIGDELTATVLEKKGDMGYSSENGVPIILPECSASEGDTIRVAVKEYTETGVKATIASLSTESRPDVDDVLNIEVELRTQGSQTVAVHDGIPIEISQPALPMGGILPIKITEVRANTLASRVEFASYSGLSEGDQILIEDPERRGGQLVARHHGIPVIVPDSKSVPLIPCSIPVTVTKIGSDAAFASIRPRRDIQSIDNGERIPVTTNERTGKYLLGEYEGYPVWISWPFDESEYPRFLTVEITEISDSVISASPPVLPGTTMSWAGDIIPARVNEVHSNHISASVVEPVEGEPYELPVMIPVSFEVSGEIGVEIVGHEQSFLVGIIRTTETGPNATQASVYLQKTQEALLGGREKRFEAAAESAREAADATTTAARQAEALRFVIFASGEAILSTGGGEDEVLDQIAGPADALATLELPDTYRALLDTELELYEELLYYSGAEVPDSPGRLQRIAYNVDLKGRLNEIVGVVLRELVESNQNRNAEELQRQFPHQLLVHRVSQLCRQPESPPERASFLFNQYPPIERMKWAIPPESRSEVIPEDSVTVAPKTLDSSVEKTPTESMGSGKKPAEEQTPNAADSDTTPLPEPTEGDEDPEEDGGSDDPVSTVSTGMGTSDGEAGNGSSPDIPSVPATTEPSLTPDRASTLRDKAEDAASENPIRDTSSADDGSRYHRASAIKEYVKARADGECEACGDSAPFSTRGGEPYLETHHVEELGQGGEDHPDKVAAVCPTCHKWIHYGEHGSELNDALRERLEAGLADVGVD